MIAKKNLGLEKLLNKLSKYEAIIIDDIGYVGQYRDEMEVLFTFLLYQGILIVVSRER